MICILVLSSLIAMISIAGDNPPEEPTPTVTHTSSTTTVCTPVVEVTEICYTDYCVDYDTYENDTVYCVDLRETYCRNNTITTQQCTKTLYSGTMNYDNGSEFVPIETDIKDEVINVLSTDYSAYNDRGIYNVYYKSQSSSVVSEPVRFTVDDYTLTITPNSLKFLGQTNKHKKQSFVNITGNYGIYEDQFGDGIDLRYSYYNEMLKKELIINSLQELKDAIKSSPSGDDILQLKFTVKGYNVSDATQLNNLKIGSTRIDFSQDLSDVSTDDKIEFLDENNNTIYYFPQPYVEDADGNRSMLNYTYNVNRFDNLVIKVEVPYSYLENAVYPVVIDPTVQLSNETSENLEDHWVVLREPDTVQASNDIATAANLSGNYWEGFLKFNISSVNGYIENARLDLKRAGGESAGDVGFNFSVFSADNNWTEDTITWNNKPNIDLSLNSSNSFITPVSFIWYNFSVTNIVLDSYPYDNITFAVLPHDVTGTSGRYGIYFRAKEYSIVDQRPKLTIDYNTTINISGCTVLNKNYVTYFLTADIIDSTTSNCMHITANGVTLDCQGYKIDSDAGAADYGVQLDNGLDGVTIRNCTITDWDTASIGNSAFQGQQNNLQIINNSISSRDVGAGNDHGISLYALNNTNISNNNIFSNGGDGINVRIDNSTIEKNNVYSNDDQGMFILSTSAFGFTMPNIIRNNNIYSNDEGIRVSSYAGVVSNNTIYGNADYGLRIANSDNSTFINNTIYNNTVAELNIRSTDGINITNNNIYNCTNLCIEITTSSNNILFSENIINSSTSHAINILGNSFNNIFKNMNITNIGGTGIVISTDSNSTFLNVTYFNESVITGLLIRKWYYRAHVNDTLGNDIDGATVKIYNVSGDLMTTLTTTNGYTPIYEIIEYVNTGSKSYYSNYTINITHSSYLDYTTTYNVSAELNNINHTNTITQDLPPTYSNIITSGTNKTNTTVIFNATWAYTLAPLSGWLFEHNQTGTRVNETFNTTWGANNESTYSLNITLTRGQIFTWKFYANDSAGNMNESMPLQTFTILNTDPTLKTDLAFINSTIGHNFTVSAVFTDLDTAMDISSHTIETSSGTCQYKSNTTSSNDFTVKYNCTGTALTETTIRINATDLGGITINSSQLSNTYPNNAPTISGAELNKTSGVLDTDSLNCTISDPVDLDLDTITDFFEWYKDSVAQNLNSFNLSNSFTSVAETWFCEAWIGDTFENSSKFTSTSVVIGSSFVAPSIDSVNATTVTTQINSSAVNPTNNDSILNVSVKFTDADDNEWTAFFCNTPTFADCQANASGEIYAMSDVNSTAKELDRQFNVSGITSSSVTYYTFVLDNTSLVTSATSRYFHVNHYPTIPVISKPIAGSVVTTNFTLVNFTATDDDGDVINFTIYNSTDNITFSLLNTNSTEFNWTNLADDVYYLKAFTTDEHGYLNFRNSTAISFTIDSNPPDIINVTTSSTSILTTASVTLSAALNDTIGISSNACEFTVVKSNQNLGAGIGEKFNFTTTSLSGITVSRTFTADTFTAGTLEFIEAHCSDSAGNKVTNLSVNINITITAPTPPPSTGGGGGPSAEPAIVLNVTQAIGEALEEASICGNNVCQKGESPISCPVDCQLNIDTLLCFLGQEDCPTWVFTLLIWGILGTVMFVTFRRQRTG